MAASLLPAAVGYAECYLGLTQTTQNSQNGCIECLRNKKEKTLCEKYILCYRLKNIHYICGI